MDRVRALWHGAAWTFIAWGLWHGTFLVLERWVDIEVLPRWLRHLLVLFLVNAGFVIFRATDLTMGLHYLADMLWPMRVVAEAVSETVDPIWWTIIVGFAIVHVIVHGGRLKARLDGLPDWAFALGYGAASALVLPMASVGYKPFIYFQF